MYLAYVDESYTKQRYYMAALLVPDRLANSLSEALDLVVEKASKSYGVAADTELHGHDLFQAKRGWEVMSEQLRGRIGVYNDAFRAIGNHDVKIILCGVDAAILRRHAGITDTPQTVVLGHLLERINERAEQYDEFSLVIADEVDEPAKHRSDLRAYRLAGTRGYLSSQLERIVDTLHFAPSSASRLVQAADLIAFLHRRMEVHSAGDGRAIRANQALWARVAGRVAHNHYWVPPPRTGQ